MPMNTFYESIKQAANNYLLQKSLQTLWIKPKRINWQKKYKTKLITFYKKQTLTKSTNRDTCPHGITCVALCIISHFCYRDLSLINSYQHSYYCISLLF